MAQSFFIWNGKDSRRMGIIKRGPSPIIRPEERVKHIEIPGRSGDLTQTEGENIYNSYIQTATISVKGGFRVRDVYKWLRGSGYVTFDCEPDRRQKARIIGAITLDKVSRNMDHWAGEVQFYCQPLKELLAEEKVTITAHGQTAFNAGDVTSRPMFKVVASAYALTFALTGNGTQGQNAIGVSGLTSGQVIWIDSETMEVMNEARTELLTADSMGVFPVMVPGENLITGIGWSSIEIERRERFL